MTYDPDRLVELYLNQLEDELDALPRARRREVVDEIAEHIAAARAELPIATEAELRTLLERIGDPEVIAQDARERFGIATAQRGWQETAAIMLLLFGGFVFFAGWFVGVVLLWSSNVWTRRDKLIGTLVVPGGLVTTVLFMSTTLYATGETCSGSTDQTTGISTEVCSGGPSRVHMIAFIVLFVLILVGPIATAIYLSTRARRGRIAPA